MNRSKTILKNMLNEIKLIKNEKPTTNNSKKIYKKRLITFSQFKKKILDPKKNPLLNKFIKKRYIIEVESALQIYKNRFTLYKSPSSNNQFSTLYNQSEIMYKNRLNEMLSYFMTEKNKDKLINLIKNKKNDKEIYKFIKNNYKLKNSRKDKISIYRMSKISDIISYNFDKNKKIKLLDIGIGTGKKTKIIQQFTNCEIYGADIKNWGPYSNIKKFNFPFKFIQEKPYKIPYKNKMFDCIILILTLHHCEDISATINECKRILKDDGIIVIIEHDVWNDYDNMIIDIQHNIYQKIFNEKEHYRGNYFNFYEWDLLFERCGMYPDYGDRIVDNVSFSFRYDIQFVSTYKKSNNN